MTCYDKMVISFLLVMAIVAMVFQGFFIRSSEGEKVVITVNNKEYASYNFAEIDKAKTLDIKTEYGSNVVVIDRNSVYVKEADCPDKLDVKMGKICKTNQMIVCVPNRLMIEIKGGERKVDKVTY